MGNEGREKPAKAIVDSDSDSSEDEDYVPDDKVDVQSAGEDSSDDSDREQDNNNKDDDGDDSRHRNRKSHRPRSPAPSQTATSTTRSGKRRHNGPNHDESEFSKKPRAEEALDQAQVESRKNRLDALWAEMNAPVSKASSRPELIAAAARSTGLGTGYSAEAGSSQSSSSSSRMVTITTTYDFAGETVTVTKDVPEDSKEAKDFALKNKTPGSVAMPSVSSSAPSPSSSSSLLSKVPSTSASISTTSVKEAPNDTTQTSDHPSTSSNSAKGISTAPRVTTRPSILDSLAKKGPVRYVRKKSNLDALAATYGVKKPAKLNTLEKSKLDWKNFVGKEGIEDELKHHNKDGYMEKVAFLQRTDERRDQTYQELKKRK
ncbi:Craniofacial development protein 1 [Mortierella alpina]|uniref:SWR1-complex protein 5 n=1 Tax=Mortierella alpina TaxID=64518 RepID=A0A9P6IZT6_MORAP|nr:Craniofacial development protein 1 [Mortierella alpina]